MLFSFVVPVYNTAKYLARCIDSILIQDKSVQWELIVINDGSTDNSHNLLLNYAEENSCVKYLSLAHLGTSVVRGLGVQLSQGDYVIHVDSDDWVSPDYVRRLMEVVPDLPDCVFVKVETVNEITGQHQSVCTPSLTMQSITTQLLDDLTTCPSLMRETLVARIIKRTIYQIENLFDPRCGVRDDTIVTLRLFLACNTCCSSLATYYYSRNRVGSTTYKVSPEFCQGSLGVFEVLQELAWVSPPPDGRYYKRYMDNALYPFVSTYRLMSAEDRVMFAPYAAQVLPLLQRSYKPFDRIMATILYRLGFKFTFFLISVYRKFCRTS